MIRGWDRGSVLSARAEPKAWVRVEINTEPSVPARSFAVWRQFEKLWLVVIQCEQDIFGLTPKTGEAHRVPGAKFVIDSVEPSAAGSPCVLLCWWVLEAKSSTQSRECKQNTSDNYFQFPGIEISAQILPFPISAIYFYLINSLNLFCVAKEFIVGLYSIIPQVNPSITIWTKSIWLKEIIYLKILNILK